MIEKVSFSEAVELLARRLGLPPRQRASPARQRERERMLSLHEEAAGLFQAALRKKAGTAALAYLHKRGLAQESIEGFGLGYAPDEWEALLNAMRKKGFSGQELAAAGLAVPREDRFYDRFRNRLIFPIRDATGRVIAFGGRALAKDQQAKYLNSPETILFRKSQTLWAFDRARRAMADAGRVVVVEGYLDAIACHEAGLTETVATMGTALTGQHVELLRRQVNRLLLAFDSDSAGLAAALRGREHFQRAALEVRVVTLPAGLDPDDVIRQRGADAFRQLAEEAPPMVEWELARILSRAEGKGEQARLEALRDAIAALARVPPGPDREYYVRWLAERYGPDSPDRRRPLEAELRQALAAEIKRASRRSRRIPAAASGEDSAAGRGPERPAARRLQAGLLAAFLQRSDLAERHLASLEVEDFPAESQRAIFEALRRLLARKDSVSPANRPAGWAEELLAELEPEARSALAELALEYLPEERIEESVAAGVGRLIETRLRREETELSRRLDEAGSKIERETIQQQLTEIARRRSQLAGRRIVGER